MKPEPPRARHEDDEKLARDYVARLAEEIDDFRATLKDGEQVVAEVILSSGRVVYADWFGYYNPHLIVVEGHDSNDQYVRALVAQWTMQVLLHAGEKDDPEARPIGFETRQEPPADRQIGFATRREPPA